MSDILSRMRLYSVDKANVKQENKFNFFAITHVIYPCIAFILTLNTDIRIKSVQFNNI